MVSQRDSSSSSFRARILHLLLSLVAGLLGSLAFYIGVYYITTYHGPSSNTSLNWPIYANTTRLEVRDEIASRDLLSAIGDFFKGGTGANATGGILQPLLDSFTSLLSGAAGPLLDGLAEPAKFLGVGLASGALIGLNQTVPTGPTPTGTSKIAESLGEGLTSTIFASDAVKGLIKVDPNAPGGLLGGSAGTVGQAALALAQGLGSGAATGLNLSTSTTPAFNTNGVSGIAGNFGLGLSSTLATSIKLPSTGSLLGSVTGLLGPISLSDIGTAAGSGLGEGTAIGLGFQADAGNLPSTIPGITKGFTKGLSSSFLQNGTVLKLVGGLVAAGPKINFGKVAEGLATGLVTGIGSQISPPSGNSTPFDDGVGGAATGFGHGLGSEGAKLVTSLLQGLNAPKPSSNRRSLEIGGVESNTEPRQTAYKRATAINATDLSSLLSTFNISLINPFVQNSVSSLQCDGFGGLVAVFVGLKQSKTLDLGNGMKLDSGSFSNVSLPDQDFVITHGRNTYKVNPAKGMESVSVNGMGLSRIFGVGIAHITFAIIAHFTAIPLLFIVINGLRISRLFDRSPSTMPVQPVPKWLTWLAYSIIPFAVVTFGLGIGLSGTGRHFATPHQVLGFFIFFQTLLAAGIMQYLRQQEIQSLGNPSTPLVRKLKIANLVNLGLLFLFTELTLFFSFAEVASLSVCVSQTLAPTSMWGALGAVLIGPLTLAVGLQALYFWLKWIEYKKMTGDNPKLGEKLRPQDIRRLEV